MKIFLQNLPLPQTEWAYPAFVELAETRKAHRAKAEFMRLGTKNGGPQSWLSIVLMYLVEYEGWCYGKAGEGSFYSDDESGIGSSSCRVQCFCKAHNSCEDSSRSPEDCWVLLSSLSGWFAGHCWKVDINIINIG